MARHPDRLKNVIGLPKYGIEQTIIAPAEEYVAGKDVPFEPEKEVYLPVINLRIKLTQEITWPSLLTGLSVNPVRKQTHRVEFDTTYKCVFGGYQGDLRELRSVGVGTEKHEFIGRKDGR